MQMQAGCFKAMVSEIVKPCASSSIFILRSIFGSDQEGVS